MRIEEVIVSFVTNWACKFDKGTKVIINKEILHVLCGMCINIAHLWAIYEHVILFSLMSFNRRQ